MNGTAKALGKIKTYLSYKGLETGNYIATGIIFEWVVKNTTWVQMPDGIWVNCGATFNLAQILTYPSVTPPPPPTKLTVVRATITLEYSDKTFSDPIPMIPLVMP